MSEAARRPSELRPNVCRRLLGLLEGLGSIIPQNSSHPTQVAIRTYTLALCLSLTPALAPFLKRSKKHDLNELIRVLSREFGATGFAFSITVAIGGGSFIREFWRLLDGSEWDLSETQNPLSNSAAWIKERLKYMRVSSAQKTFISNILSTSAGLWLLQAGRARFRSTKGGSKTLDLTLLVFVRALDAAVQSFVARRSGSRRESDAGDTSFTRAPRDEAYTKRQLLRTRIDAFVFWACSARIMWCFFYAPQRLPKSYVKWINALANADTRLLDALRAIRTKDWLYRKGPPSPLLTTYARDLGYPASWGDPIQLPAFGHEADQAWRALGVTGRAGVAGIPCQLVHGTVGSSLGLSHSCTANAGLRGLVALMEAIVLYLPVQFVPILLSRPRSLLDPHRTLESLLGVFRSATFLSTFVASYYYAVCLTRTLVLARLFPSISHNFWDGSYGCILAGSLVCGSSIFLENGRRRGEMALYVLPKAVRACLPHAWLRGSNRSVRIVEQLAFVLSLSSLLTAANHHPYVLRGLSKWGLRFIVRGPDVASVLRARSKTSEGNE